MKLVLQIAAGVLIAWAAEKLISLVTAGLLIHSAVSALDQISLPALSNAPSAQHTPVLTPVTRPAPPPLPARKRCQITKADGTTAFCTGPLTDGQ